jgi:hypothetical protein
MIRAIITPHQTDVIIHLPESFVGKEVEFIAFTKDEATSKSVYNSEASIHFASEKSLAKDWLTDEENEAWKNL